MAHATSIWFKSSPSRHSTPTKRSFLYTDILVLIKPPYSSFPVIMSRATLNLLRSATSSLSSLAATRSYCPAHRRAAIRYRAYSETTSEKAKETSEDSGDAEQKAGDKPGPAPPLSEFQARLKVKEDEVSDLTVRSFPSLTSQVPFRTCRKI